MNRVELDASAGMYIVKQLKDGRSLSAELLRLGTPKAVWAPVTSVMTPSRLLDLEDGEITDGLDEKTSLLRN
jgi:hypothetical protein